MALAPARRLDFPGSWHDWTRRPFHSIKNFPIFDTFSRVFGPMALWHL